MLSANTTYRPGTRALIYMIAARQKYPLMLAGIMAIATVLIALFKTHIPTFAMPALALFERCGWFFTILLGVCLALSVVPEYLGIAFRLDDKAIRLRYGILSYREIGIPYEKIIEIDIAQNRAQRMLRLCSFFMKTDQSEKTGKKVPREAGLMHIDVSLAKDLRETLSIDEDRA